MSTYDLKRLEIAIQYIRRMSAGRNPVTNRPAPENEVLNNINVNRCLKFIDEVLTDVHKSGGTVGLLPPKERTPKHLASEIFPYEILKQYRYVQDQQISYFLKQLGEYLPEDQKLPIAATAITTWLRENGYLEKRAVNDTGKENSVPTKKGEALGLYGESAGIYPNEYYRVFYNENAQRFIIDNFRRILTESEAIRERNRSEKKKSASPRSARQSGINAQQSEYAGRQGSSNVRQGEFAPRYSDHTERQGENAPRYRDNTGRQGGSSAGTGAGRYGRPNELPGFAPNPSPAYNLPNEVPPVEDLPQEYYDMLSEGWAPSDGEVPW